MPCAAPKVSFETGHGPGPPNCTPPSAPVPPSAPLAPGGAPLAPPSPPADCAATGGELFDPLQLPASAATASAQRRVRLTAIRLPERATMGSIAASSSPCRRLEQVAECPACRAQAAKRL